MSHPIPRWTNVAAMVLAPVFGLIAAVATPGLSSTTKGELTDIAAHPERFHIYALAITISGYLLIPAFFGLMALLREKSPRLSYLAGGLAQIGIVIAVGDGATELMYWKMGVAGHRDLMVSLSDAYDSGSGWIYSIGGLAIVIGSIAMAVGLWRSRVVPRWVGAGVAVGVLANLVGFSVASQPVLIGSYVVLLAVLGRAALALVDRDEAPAPVSRQHAAATV